MIFNIETYIGTLDYYLKNWVLKYHYYNHAFNCANIYETIDNFNNRLFRYSVPVCYAFRYPNKQSKTTIQNTCISTQDISNKLFIYIFISAFQTVLAFACMLGTVWGKFRLTLFLKVYTYKDGLNKTVYF